MCLHIVVICLGMYVYKFYVFYMFVLYRLYVYVLYIYKDISNYYKINEYVSRHLGRRTITSHTALHHII